MDIEESIKKNKNILRQLTSLNNEIKKLNIRVKKLEQKDNYYPNNVEIKKMPLYEGTN